MKRLAVVSAVFAVLVMLKLAGCKTVPVVPTPEPSPSPSVQPSPVPSASPTPQTGWDFTDPVPLGQKLKIYYAQDPTTLKKGWGHLNVFDQDSGAFPVFRPKVAQAAADAIRQYPDAINCGYIALGYSKGGSIRLNGVNGSYTHVLTIQQIKDHTERWLSIPGINCIFLDMAGHDYAWIDGKGKIERDSGGLESWVTPALEKKARDAFKARQLEVQRFLRARGVVSVWNSWQPDWIPLAEFTSSDWYLFENAQNDKGRGYKRWAYWKANKPAGARAFAVTTGSYDRASLEAAAKQYGISAIQYKTNAAFENED